jgi:flagellar biogenesis protein FliO
MTISQSCIQNLQSLRRKPIFASPPSSASSSKASSYAYLILATVVIALLILTLPFLLRKIRSMRKLRK